MIFAGDVAIAHGEKFRFTGFPRSCLQQPWCFNLEGPVASPSDVPDWGIYNSSNWHDSFEEFVLGPVFIGNNHVHDIPDGIRRTKLHVAELGLSTFGAGDNVDDAAAFVVVGSGQFEYALLGFGWPVIGCRFAGRRRPGVNPLESRSVMKQAANALRQAGGARVVAVMHANYEFERYPQPAHRKLAMDLIDSGVYAVISHHPHIVGPVERYKNRTIAYSVGNWAFSYSRFFGGRLRFPASSFHQIAVELGEVCDIVHHARFSPAGTVTYEVSECVASPDFSLRPEFEGLGHADYLRWFSSNRTKRKGLPIYVNADRSLPNWLRDRWVAARQMLIDSAAKIGAKSLQRSA